MRFPTQQPLRSHVQTLARRREDERTFRFHRLLAISMMSALTLGAVLLARAESWVTVNADGSVTRTEAQTRSVAQAAPYYDDATRATQRALDEGDVYDTYPQDTQQQPTNIYNGNVYNGNVYNVYGNEPIQSTPSPGNITFFSGTYTPVPVYGNGCDYGNGYGYGSPYAQAGVGYRLGTGISGSHSPVLRIFPTIPTNAYAGYPPVYGSHCPPQFYAYPPYATSGTYYSGPIGGGGTIYSNSTTTSNGYGVSLGNGGLNISIGNKRQNRTSSTTVVTTGGR